MIDVRTPPQRKASLYLETARVDAFHLSRVLGAVAQERERQEQKGVDKPGWETCASATMDPHVKLAVLTEEVGEVARALLEENAESTANLRAELVQVAAVAVAWVEALTPPLRAALGEARDA